MSRLIDADALIRTVEHDEGISWENHGDDDLCVRKKYIDNAPTVEDITEDDIKEAIKTGYRDGYGMAKAKYEKPTEIDCSKCDYLKFSKSFIESVVKLMNTYGIESVEDLSRELKHIANGDI